MKFKIGDKVTATFRGTKDYAGVIVQEIEGHYLDEEQTYAVRWPNDKQAFIYNESALYHLIEPNDLLKSIL